MERYNGWGYRRYHQQVLSPYLWSSASHYLRGKYVADGSWSDTAVSRQVGGAALIRRLDERGAIDDLDQPAAPGPLFHLSEQAEDRVEDLQRFLNTFEGNRLLVDGVPGLRTSAAVEQLFGWALREGP